VSPSSAGDTAVSANDGDKSVPWPSDEADVKRRWRVGRSCQRARWLFLRFAASCVYIYTCHNEES